MMMMMMMMRIRMMVITKIDEAIISPCNAVRVAMTGQVIPLKTCRKRAKSE